RGTPDKSVAGSHVSGFDVTAPVPEREGLWPRPTAVVTVHQNPYLIRVDGLHFAILFRDGRRPGAVPFSAFRCGFRGPEGRRSHTGAQVADGEEGRFIRRYRRSPLIEASDKRRQVIVTQAG